MPIYGRGLYYGSPTGTYKDAYVVPDSGRFPVFSGFGQTESGNASGAAVQTGKIVAVATVLASLALFGLTLMLGRRE